MTRLDERGFVFLDRFMRPVWCALYHGSPWLFWWHPDRHWVTMREVTQDEVFLLPRNLSAAEQDMYHEQNRAWMDSEAIQ